jgi:excisionase family DNA binding protein
MPAPSILIPIPETAERLGHVAELTVRRLIKAGKLRAVHVGRRVMVREQDLEKYLDDNEVQS